MSAVSLPSYPGIPKDPGSDASPEAKRDYDRKMLEYQENMARYNRTLQFLQQQQTEEQTTRTNMSKSRHDAMMAVTSNLKA